MTKITNIISHIFGVISSYEFPIFLQEYINLKYIEYFSIDMSEFQEYKSYRSLNELFTRKMTKERNMAKSKMVIPSDSKITAIDTVSENSALQIKGVEYSINEFLKDDKLDLNGYDYINFYLSPRDYHRFHAPCNMQITKISHIAGFLRPVNISTITRNSKVFCENERVVLEGIMENKRKIYFIALGALNVGSISINKSSVKSNNINYDGDTIYNTDISFLKGEEVGYFNMGSTIVLFVENDNNNIIPKEGTYVKFGDKLVE